MSRRRIILSAVIGALVGFFALHPYTSFVYGIYEPRVGAGGVALPHVERHIHDIFSTFRSEMLPMGIPFALIGAAAGLFFGFWMEAERRRDEMEKRAVAVKVLRELVVTLSHYLLNASTVIGGYSSLMLKKAADPEMREKLDTIKEESDQIEAVVRSLQSLKEVETEPYGEDSETMIIDIEREIRERLEKRKAGARGQAA